MHPLIINRLAAATVMPLVAAGGWGAYSYYQPYPAAQDGCIVLTTDITTTTYQPQVVSLQRFFVDEGYLRGNPNGYFDQPTTVALERFQADNGIPVTGRMDGTTRTIIERVSCPGYDSGYPNGYYPSGYPYGATGQLSVQGIDAPRSVSVGQSAAWTVRVAGRNNAYGGTLHYSVVWGDENQYGNAARAQYGDGSVQSSASFTHTYGRSGTYTPVFTVSDDYGHTAHASATVTVSGGCPSYNYNCSSYSGYNGYNGSSAPCTYYDRNCYGNGQYIGSSYNGYTYNGPGDTCYYLNGQWQGSCGNTPTYTYNGSSYTGSGVDYSCYYDRACYAQLQGRSY